jgi:hypothetical protein
MRVKILRPAKAQNEGPCRNKLQHKQGFDSRNQLESKIPHDFMLRKRELERSIRLILGH